MERICQFHIRGRCNRSNCEFKHSPLPNRSITSNTNLPYPNRPCKFFESSGFCRIGENCRFLHEKSLDIPKRRPMVDSDEEILKGVESDDDSVVSGFTEHMAVLAREPEFDFSDREEEDYESESESESKIEHSRTGAEKKKEDDDPLKDIHSSPKCDKSMESSVSTFISLDDASAACKDIKSIEEQTNTSTHTKSKSDESPNVEKDISVQDNNENEPSKEQQVCPPSMTGDNVDKQENHTEKEVHEDPKDDTLLNPSLKNTETQEPSTPISNSKSRTKPKRALHTQNLDLPKFDPDKFKPGYIPPIIKDGNAEYAVVVTGVKDTGLCGKYWGDLNNLSSRRRSRVSNNQDQYNPSPITTSTKKSRKRSSSRSDSKNTKKLKKDDNMSPLPEKKSLDAIGTSTEKSQIASNDSMENDILKNALTGTKQENSKNVSQESTCDADNSASMVSKDFKKDLIQSQKSVENKTEIVKEAEVKKSKNLSPKRRKEDKSSSVHEDDQNPSPKRRKGDSSPHKYSHSLENPSKEKSLNESSVGVGEIKKSDKYQTKNCYVSLTRSDSLIKSYMPQINLEKNYNGSDAKKSSTNQETSTSASKTVDSNVYSTIHECVSTTSDDSSNVSNEAPLRERYVPYDENKWANIGKDNLSMDAVQYTKALSLQNHLLSFLRIKGNSMKGMSYTNKNSVIFVVIEGEISVVLHSCKKQFYAKKGDSFHVPPNFSYNLINQKVREAELTIFQF